MNNDDPARATNDREESIKKLAERDDWVGRLCEYMRADDPRAVFEKYNG